MAVSRTRNNSTSGGLGGQSLVGGGCCWSRFGLDAVYLLFLAYGLTLERGS